MLREQQFTGTSGRPAQHTARTGYAILAMCAIFIPWFIDCTSHSIAGVGSEVTNGGVTGLLVKEDGTPARGAIVRLVPCDYDPVKSGLVPDLTIDTASPQGEFSLSISDSGVYNIEGVLPGSGERTLITDVATNGKDQVTVPVRKIRKPGSVKVVLPWTSDSVEGYVYLPGTTNWAGIVAGVAMIDSVPAGHIPSVYYSQPAAGAQIREISNDITVTSGDTAVIADTVLWKYSKNLYLNTTASGAGVSGTVSGFPLLVRLTAATFDFSQAETDGADLRFTKADGTLLSYGIERYDSANNRAEIWVSVDTVFGNNNTQFITMLWGNPLAPAFSDQGAVFDTAEGYRAVWHMEDTTDATIHGNLLRRSGAGNPEAVPGLIGRCMFFDSSHYFDAGPGPALKGETDFTVSVWVKTTMTYKGYLISNKHSSNTGQYGLEVFETAVCNFWTWNPDSGKYLFDTYSRATVTDGNWHLLTGVRQGTLSSIYIDGVLDATLSAPVVSLDSSLSTYVGFDNFQSDKYFKGYMDEAQILEAARSADWIKLCFMNQKEDDALIAFR